MLITIELTPEQESRFQQEATAKGLPLPEYLRKLLDETAPPSKFSEQTMEARRAAVNAIRGAFRYAPFTSEDVMQERYEE